MMHPENPLWGKRKKTIPREIGGPGKENVRMGG